MGVVPHHHWTSALSSEDTDALIADLDARGVWQLQSIALLEIHVVDTDTMSYLSHSPAAVLASTEAEKKQKYCAASSDCYATFTPLCFLVDELVGDDTNCFFLYLASSLSVIIVLVLGP